jgi:DNA primase
VAGTHDKRSGRIAQSSIESVLARTDLVDLASAYTQLHRRGAEHSGRCPFHDERTPSFWVNPTKGVYHCFGCGASGDAITFVQAKQGLDFVEAIEMLADRYRIELTYEDGGPGSSSRRTSKRRLYELSDAAAAFYEAHLWSSSEAAPVREYLEQRHISAETARAFRVGYSPERGLLASKARDKGFSNDELSEARLMTSNGRDFFRGRLMVPIVDRASRVIGFGARKLREEQYGGKYVNSADGPLFHKKRTIFLSPSIQKAAQDAGYVVVVEGYMDVIAMWQAGIRNVCAVMGTALTEEQVLELKRFAPRAYFAFDPDAAGQVATLRALQQARSRDLDVRVVLLPEGEDPADVLHGPDGAERMREMLDAGVSLLHYRTSVLLGSGDLGEADERDRIYREAITLFRSVPDGPQRREQIKRLENVLRFDTAEAEEFHRLVGSDTPMNLVPTGSREPRWREQKAVRERIATTGSRSTAVMRERRLLAAMLKLADISGGKLPDIALPEPEALALGVHRRAFVELTTDGSAALAPARVREDEELFTLIAELATLAERDRLGTDDAELIVSAVTELARAVELQHLDRRAGELRGRVTAGEDDPELLNEWSRISQRRRLLDPRAGNPAP